MSKGSRPRPFSISQDEYANRMDSIFGKKPPKEPYVPPPLPNDLTTVSSYERQLDGKKPPVGPT